MMFILNQYFLGVGLEFTVNICSHTTCFCIPLRYFTWRIFLETM